MAGISVNFRTTYTVYRWTLCGGCNSKGLEETNAELAKTQVLIRDYNGLRATINECKQRLDRGEGGQENTKWTWAKMGYLVGLAGVVVAVVALLK